MEHWVPPGERELRQWRAELPRLNGIEGLAVIDPSVPGWAEQAARQIHEQGFCAVASVVEASALQAVSLQSERLIEAVLQQDRYNGVNGPFRYSLGGCLATGACLHLPEWAALVDLPRVEAVLGAVWGSLWYNLYGADGNFSLPGSGYQPLHSDMAAATKREVDTAGRVVAVLPVGELERPGRTYTAHNHKVFWDPHGRVSIRQLPCPDICVNIPLSGFSQTNGPTRLIPGTHLSASPIPTLAEEPDWMRFSTPCPLPPGAAIFRDPRVWHGGTPNVSEDARVMLAYLYAAPWVKPASRVLMPPCVYKGLSSRAQDLCRSMVGGDDHGPEGGGSGGGAAWGDLRPGLSVDADHAMSDESVHR